MGKIDLKDEKTRTMILGSFFGVILLWAYVAMILIPKISDSGNLGREVKQTRDALKTLNHILANEDRVREQHGRLIRSITALRSRLPAEEELPSIIERLSDIASKTQVKIQAIYPQISFTEEDLVDFLEEGDSAKPVFRTIPIQIDGVAGYHQIGTFLSLVEAEPLPMEIASFRIMADKREFRRHHMRLVLNVFFAANTFQDDQEAGAI